MIAQTISTPKLTIVNGQEAKKSNRTASPVIREEILTELTNKFLLRGDLIMPCIPSMKHDYFQRIHAIFKACGITPTPEKLKELHQQILAKINQGFQESPHSRIRIKSESILEPERGLTFNIGLMNYSVVAQYQDWLQNRKPPLFGTHPDAKLMAVAAALGEPSQVPVLDVGAGTGRNTIPLAQAGYPVDAVELTPEFVQQIQSQAQELGLPVRVFLGDILAPREVKLRPAHYRLVVLAEVVASHFKNVEQLRLLLAKMADCLQSGGLLLFSTFLTVDDYEPNEVARQLSQVNWSCLFTRQDLAEAIMQLPLEIVADESVVEYEKKHLPIEAWPPTGWFIKWREGENLFPLKDRDFKSPLELRWILCRRK
jgi:SAM-dependent methyltransferase